MGDLLAGNQFDCDHFSSITNTPAGLDDSGVSSGSILESSCNVVEEFGHNSLASKKAKSPSSCR
jgi:hypothetical protein